MSPASFFESPATALTAREITQIFDMEPFPLGGKACAQPPAPENNATDKEPQSVSTFLVLLEVGDVLAWHRYQGIQNWFWHAGGPVTMSLSPNGHDASALHLGSHFQAGQKPHLHIPTQSWMTAETLGEWSLLGCVYAPRFAADLFERAADNWFPKPRPPAA